MPSQQLRLKHWHPVSYNGEMAVLPQEGATVGRDPRTGSAIPAFEPWRFPGMNRGFGSGRARRGALTAVLLTLVLFLPSPGCATATAAEENGDNGDRRPTPRRPSRDGQDDRRSTLKRPKVDRPILRRAKTGRPTARRSGSGAKEIEDQKRIIAGLEEDLKTRDEALTSLQKRLDALSEGEGGESADRIQALSQELETASKQLEDERLQHEGELQQLRDQLAVAAGVEEGMTVSEIIKERDTAREERDSFKSELEAIELSRSYEKKQMEDLETEKRGWDEKLAAVRQETDAAEKAKASVESERDALTVEVGDLKAQVDLAWKAQAEAEDKGKGGVEDLEKRMVGPNGLVTAVGKNATDAQVAAGKAKTVGLLGFLAGIGALSLGVFLFFIIRTLKYHVAVVQAHSAGGMEPAEVEEIVSARVGELAGSLQTMAGGADIDVSETVKQAVSDEMKSETFQGQIQQIVATSAPAAKGGGGGGLSAQDVKIMVDNQFRAITTYLKNEAVPKMVEDALRKKA